MRQYLIKGGASSKASGDRREGGDDRGGRGCDDRIRGTPSVAEAS